MEYLQKAYFSGLESDVSQVYLDMLMENADLGVLQCRLDSGLSIVYANPFFYRLIDNTQEEFWKQYNKHFMECVCNMDRLDFKQKLRKATKDRTEVAVEIRLKKKHGELLKVAFYGRLGSNAEHGDYIVCMIRDIQYVHKIESDLKMQNVRYQVLKAITNEPIFEYDDLSDTLMITQNKDGEYVRTIHNYRSDLAKSGYIYKEDLQQYIEELEQSLNQENFSRHEFRTNLFDDEYVWYRAVYTNIIDSKTGMVKLIGKFENIHKDKMHQQELMAKSMYDTMTKLYNRATAKMYIEDCLQQYQKEQHALLIIDIDNFKMVNDNLGHMFGDTVLINFAAELKKIYQDGEIIGRIGGDEFMVFMPHMSASQLEKKAEQTCHIFDHVYSGNLNEIHVSTSVGISIFPEDGQDYLSLFQLADQALYYSKQQGKNQFNYYRGQCDATLASSEKELLKHYKMETREHRNNQATRDMIEFAFHILTETKDVTSGIGLVLESLFKQLSVKAAVLFEMVDVTDKIKGSYVWQAGQGMQKEKTKLELNLQQWDALKQFLQTDSQQQITDISELEKLTPFYEFCQENASCVVLCDGIWEEEELTNCLFLLDDKKGRVFDSDEKNMVRVVQKIVSSYLTQLRNTQRAKRKMERLLNYDVVTGRYRFDKFKSKLRSILDEAKQQEDGIYVILHADVCDFKKINEKYGYSVGDQVLYELSELIRRHKEYMVGCRDFADNFISLMKFAKQEDCDRVLQEIEQEFALTQQRFLRHTTTLITGVYIIQDYTMNVSQMIANANLARKHAKEEKKQYVVFDAATEKHFWQKQQIESNMEEALHQGDFKVFLQPKYDLQTGQIVAAEALTRWQQKDQHFMYPNDFIPVLEENGFITQVDFYVLEVICKCIKDRIREHQPYVNISINQSRYLLHDKRYIEKISHMLERYDIPASLLEFELTESMFLEDNESMMNSMRQLKQLGVTVSIGEFGTGEDSWQLLEKIPADVIKIGNLFWNSTAKAKEENVRKTIEIAKKHHKKVVCEGVETKEQENILKTIGCDMVQGYLYAKPVPLEDFFEML